MNKIKHSYLLILDEDNKPVFEIDIKGNVYWLKNGVFTRAKTNKDLGMALGKALTQIVKQNKILAKQIIKKQI